MTNDDILKRVREIQRAAATATTQTIREKREFFARVVLTRLSEEPADSDLWQELRITTEGALANYSTSSGRSRSTTTCPTRGTSPKTRTP